MMPIVIFILMKIWLLVQLGNIRSQATDLEDPLLIGGLKSDKLRQAAMAAQNHAMPDPSNIEPNESHTESDQTDMDPHRIEK